MSNWDDDGFVPSLEDLCYGCKEKEMEKLCVTEFLEEIVDQVYGKVNFDADLLENSLEHLCDYFGVKFPAGKSIKVVSIEKLQEVA